MACSIIDQFLYIWVNIYIIAYVFFDGTYAYSVDKPNKEFMDDIAKHEMKSVDVAEKHYGIEIGI